MRFLADKIAAVGIIPVIKINDANSAPELARALIDGGIPIAEITFRTSAAPKAIKTMRDQYPDMLVGAGTVLSVETAKQAAEAGAQFIVSPGFNASVADYCLSEKIPVIPGINNPSQIEAAAAKGLSVLKFFPAEASGGAAALKAFEGPFEKISFVPTGGINLGNIKNYARLKNVLAVAGSWMAAPDTIQNGRWTLVSDICRESINALHGFAFAHLGINNQSRRGAAEAVDFFEPFGFYKNDLDASCFLDSKIEIMKSPARGENGHLGIYCYNVERALAYLAAYGFKGLDETARRSNGGVDFIYLNKAINGFAVHLSRIKE